MDYFHQLRERCAKLYGITVEELLADDRKIMRQTPITYRELIDWRDFSENFDIEEVISILKDLPAMIEERGEDHVMRVDHWQATTSERLMALGYAGFSFGPGVNWWPIDQDGNKVAGPFTTTEAFDAWLTEQETTSSSS